MRHGDFFEAQQETERLAEQASLLYAYEIPVYERILSGRTGIRLLDIGCHDGAKTTARFSRFPVRTVVGLEYCDALAKRAQAQYGNETFSFFACDVETDGFPAALADIMRRCAVEAFDVVHLSFVLSHLNKPLRLLKRLRSVLSESGVLLIVEADDACSAISQDPDELLHGFLRVLAQDPFAGDRTLSQGLAQLAADAGYCGVETVSSHIQAGKTQHEKKSAIFDVFFSYVPADFERLRKRYPDNATFRACAAWLSDYFEPLHALILSDRTSVCMGINLLLCRAGTGSPQRVPLPQQPAYVLELLTAQTVDIALALCNSCVGENLYTHADIEAAVTAPHHFFWLLKTEADEIIGYLYYYLTELDEVAALSRTSRATLATMTTNPAPVVGTIRSIGLVQAHRHRGLSLALLRFCVEQLTLLHADLAFGVFWKPSPQPPMQPSLQAMAFQHLCDVSRVWYDNEALICPVCGGRCVCDAALYYKELGEPHQ